MKNQAKKQFPPSQNGIGKKRAGDIEILHTDTLIKEVEKVFGASHPDPLEIDKAKKLLKEHEQSLIDAIAMLADASDGESEEGEHRFPHQQSVGWGNRRQYGGNPQGDKYRGDDVTAGGGREGSDGDHLAGHGADDDT